jgi:hypothetical protein
MIRNFLAGCVLFVFVVSAVLFYAVVSLYLIILNKDFYAGDKFVSYSYDVVLSQLPNYFDENLPEGFSSEYVLEVIKKYITVSEFKPIVVDFGNQVNEALDGGGHKEFNIDLSVFAEKRNLIAEEFANHLMKSLNTCINSSVYNPENPTCIPSGVSRDDFVRQFKATFDRKLFSQMPGRFVFSLNFPDVGNVFCAYLAFLVVLLLLTGLIVSKPFVRVLKWVMFGIFCSLILFASVFLYSWYYYNL